MNKIIIICLFLGFLPSCRDYKGENAFYKIQTYIISHECFICQAVPTIAHKRLINEKESITVHYCQDHLADYMLEDD